MSTVPKDFSKLPHAKPKMFQRSFCRRTACLSSKYC